MTSSKRQKRKVLIFGAVSILIFLIYAVIKNTDFETYWRYERYNDGYRLISYTQAYNDDTSEIVIPSEYNGLDVVAIDDKAFYNNKKILKVTIPDTVTELGASVFKDCKNLNEIRFGENITTIGGECFKNCVSLKEVVLPQNVTELRGEAFMGCESLKSVVLPQSITEIRGNMFENCSSLQTIEIPYGVTRIAAHAFYGCSSLYYVYVPDTVNEIGSSAFRLCKSLYEIEVPENININERAFKESPTVVKTKFYTDEMYMEFLEDAYTDFDVYVLYNIERGKDEIYCFFENTIVITTSEEFRKKHLQSNRKNDLLYIEEYDDFIEYLQKAKDEGVTTVVFYAYSEKASEHAGEPYFFVTETEIEYFIDSLSESDEE